MNPQQLVLVAKARHLATSGRGAQIRRASGLSLAEIGDAIGTGPTTIWRWERGDRMPRGPRAAAWATLMESLSRQKAS